MSTENDTKILELKEEIEKKERFLLKPTLTRRTNQILNFEGTSYNLHVINENKLQLLLIQLNTYIMSAKDLHIDLTNIMIDNYSIEDWILDIQEQLAFIRFKNKQKKLKDMKKTLQNLLSNDMKTELTLKEMVENLDSMLCESSAFTTL